MSAVWGSWGELWSFADPVQFDGPARRIHINPEVSNITTTQLYSSWVRWASLYDQLKYLPAMRTVGGDALPGGQATGLFVFLRNGWQIVVDHAVTLDGILFHDDDGVSPFVIEAGGGMTNKVAALAYSVGAGGSGSSASDVWSHPSRSLTAFGGPTKEEIAAQVRTGLLVELLHVLSIPNNPLLSVDSRLNYLDAPISAGGTGGGGITPEQYDALVGEIRSRSSLTLSEISAAASTGNAVVTEILTADVQTNMPLTGA